MRTFRFIFILGFLFIYKHVGAQELATIVQADSLSPGDVFDFTLILKKNSPETSLLNPDSVQFGENFELLSIEKFSPSPTTDSLIYHLQFFGVGDVQLEEIPFTIQKSDGSTVVRTSDIIPIFYKQQVPEDAPPDEVKPLKPIYLFSINWWPWIIGAIVLLVLTILGWREYQRRKALKALAPSAVPPSSPAPFVDPLSELNLALKRLKSSEALSQGDFKTFYTELGDALRIYMESMYAIDALESTGNEVIQKMEHHRLDTTLIQRTRELLNAAELVKFAKFIPSLDSAYSDLNRGYEFYERAKQLDAATIQRRREEYRETLENANKPKQGESV